MNVKIQKYAVYIRQFIKSPIKQIIIQELLLEIKERGLFPGIQSFLHKRAEYFFPGYDKESGYDPILSTKKYNNSLKINLPLVSKPKVSIIVPMYNQIEYTYYCVRSIFENNEFKDYEVIIADDNSSENTEFLQKHIENFVFITNETNLGFLKNCNAASKKAKGDYIVFLNNDTIVKKGWLIELLNIFENFDHVGLVGSKLVYPNGKLQEAGGIIWQDGSGWNYGNQDNPDKPEYNYVKEVDYISGASIMISAALWKETGGFDELYSPAYYEDTDLCFQVRAKGYKVIYTPFSVVLHFEGVSHGTDLKKGVKKYQAVNHQKFIDKWQHELKQKSKGGENVFFERDRTNLKKHILIVDHDLPTVDKDAGSRTISNFIDIVVEIGYQAVFLSSNPSPAKHYKKLLQKKGVEVLWGEQYTFFGQNLQKYLLSNIDNFDAVFLSRSSTCIPFMTFLRNNDYRGKIIYYGHDLGYLRLDQETILNNDLALDLQSKRLKADEDFMYEHADHSLVISYEEVTYLKNYISQPLHYFPFFSFDVSKDSISFDEREGMLFIGGFNHPPNQDAMLWFLKEIYEPLHNHGIKLTIAGSNIPPFIFEYKKRFKLLDIKSNISSANLEILYSKTKISVVPLRVGAGVKGKVIEALSKGVPVVGTYTAFEGIPKDNDFPFKGHNYPDEIVYNILQVYSDKLLWERLSAYGKEYVLKNFNKGMMKDIFNYIMK